MQYSKNELLEKFDSLAAEMGSANKAAAATGVSAPIISQLRKGQYKGDTEKQYEILAKYFEVKEAAATTYSEVAYAPISTSKKVYSTIRSCHIKGGFSIITGDAGIGKTKAIQKYAADNAENTVVITVNPCQKSAKAVLKLLALKLNIPLIAATDDLWFSIVGKLHDGMVLIVDEAQLLTFQAIETLRSIADYFDGNDQTLGVALIGNNGIRDRVEGKTREIYRQVNNRTWQRPFLQTTDVKIEDIRLLFPTLPADSAEIRFLHKIAQSAEGVRGAVRLFGNAVDNENYDLDGLAAMAKSMRINLRGIDLNNI